MRRVADMSPGAHRVHAVATALWIAITVGAFVFGWIHSVVFLSLISLYNIVATHAVGAWGKAS